MTAAAALVEDGTVWMGVDGQGTTGDDVSVWNPGKLWTFFDGRMGMASAGAGRLSQELQHEWHPPAFNGAGDVVEYVRLVAGSIEEHLHSRDALWQLVCDDDSPAHLLGAILVGLCGRVFWIGGDFYVHSPEPRRPWVAIGSGGAAAEASLFTSDRFDSSPALRLDLALHAAAAQRIEVGPPFRVLPVLPWAAMK